MIVNNENANTRLDHYLANNTEFSRSKITNLIKEGKILVNGKVARASYNVKENDIVEINLGAKSVKIRVLQVVEHTTKENASSMYEIAT